MKRLATIIACVVPLTPAIAVAHATPLSSSPESSARISAPPSEISIQFSERLDEAASMITIKGPDGSTVSSGKAQVDPADPRRLKIPMDSDVEGAYVVTWSVVSSDDGHFTRGSFPFLVGETGVLPGSQSGYFEIVQITTTPEAVAMTVELVGNGLIWAAIIIFAFAVRPYLKARGFADADAALTSGYVYILFVGIVLALGGAVAQLWLKSLDLAGIQESGLFDALLAYAGTTAGTATLVRMLAVAFVAGVLYFSRRVIVSSLRFTWQEVVLLLGMSVFAYYRAVVSHATANPFMPELSIAINFVHLIEKDFWAGASVILVILVVFRRFRDSYAPLIQRIFTLLSLNLMLVALTATYIVWLHLRAFENLFLTQWGTVLMQLLLAAVLLVIIRTYHVLSRLYRPQLFSRLLPVSLGAEAGLAVMVVFFSSTVIITSPPLPNTHGPVYSARSEGMHIDLRASVIEDGVAVLSLTGGDAQEPSITVSGASLGTISIVPEKVFENGYWLPLSFIDSEEERTVSIRVPQKDAYDAHASFTVPGGSFDDREDRRAFDSFTFILCIIGCAAFIYAYMMYLLSRRSANVPPVDRFGYPAALAMGGAVFGTTVVLALATAYASAPLSNNFKALCEADGNMWHLMLPTRAGVPLAQVPREGCMWGMGRYQYMFADEREYEYVRSFPPARVELSFEDGTPVAGQPQHFNVSVSYPDGTPARLFVDMEKLIHVVIASKDQRVFAHIHPDDTRELSEEEVEDSAFNLSYTFPSAGEYLISVDYANGIRLESSQHRVVVSGSPKQSSETATYASPARVGNYDVSLRYTQPFAGDVSTLTYEIRTDGAMATLEPYLSAAMHIAVVKNDLAAFLHTHGEVHPPGQVLPPVVVRDGKIVHSMATLSTPARFALPIDAHVIFPEPGLYTVWGQFQSEGRVYAVPFTVRVE
jgi:copper transport protein